MSEKASEMGSAGADSDLVTLRPGQVVGRYRIVSVLGQGGFGITYRAMDSELDREVAIKEYLPAALAVRQDGTTVLPRSTAAAEDFTWGRERFVAEGRTLASLQNAPAIVRVFDFLEANGTAYIVMQLLHGETLGHRLRRAGPLKPEEVDRILWPLLDGLEQVHGTGFLHRDIKPANILRAADRPQSIADWRSMLQGALTAGDAATVLAQRSQPMVGETPRKPVTAEASASARTGWNSRIGIYVGTAVLAAVAAGGYFVLAP